MAENDFSSLAVAKQYLAELNTNDVISEKCICSGAVDSVPVNYIPDETLAMLKAWESAHLIRSELKSASCATSQDGSIATGDDSTQESHEPLRYITSTAPPKPFFRNFWRSVARRALDHDREACSAQSFGSLIGSP